MKHTTAESERENASNSLRQHESKQQSASNSQPGSIASLHRTVGNQAVRRLHENGILQAKLAVSQPGDRDEREAERVADKVVSMSVPEPGASSVDRISHQSAGKEPQAVRRETKRWIETLQGGGRLLPPSARSFFEPRFGRDFSDVRVHTNSKADEAARSISAEAFTIGTDIVFRSGAYSRRSRHGTELLAHELTHVIQQQGERLNSGSGSARPIANDETVHRRLPGNTSGYSSSDAERETERRNTLDNPIAIRGRQEKGGSEIGVDALLAEVVNAAKRDAGPDNAITIIVKGQASKEGDREYNERLSLRRAENTKTAIEAKLVDSDASIRVKIDPIPLGVGEKSSAEYWKNRRATIVLEKRTIELNRPGSLTRPEPSLTREEKIQFIRENYDDPLVRSAFRLMSMKHAISDLKPYPTSWSDFKFWRSEKEVYDQIALDAYDYYHTTKQMERAEEHGAEFQPGPTESIDFIEIGTIYFPQDDGSVQ